MRKLLLIPALLLFVATASAQTNVKSHIKVKGTAEREVMPDEIYLSINIDESNVKSKTSVAAQEKDMIAALRKAGIDTESNFKVKDMGNIVDSGGFLKKSNNVTNKNYELKVNSAAQLAEAVGAIQSVGVSNMRIDRTTHSELRKIYMELRVEAIKNAREIARSLAGAIDQQIGKAILIEDSNVDVGRALQGRVAGIMIRGLNPISDAPLEYKSVKLTYSVQARFELE